MKNSLKVLSLLMVMNFTMADTAQNLSGQITDSPYENQKEESEETPFLSGTHKDKALSVKDSKGNIPAPGSSNDSWTNSIQGQSAFIDQDNSNYQEFSNDEIVKKLHKKSKSAWGFSYYMDTYDYKDADNLFNRTFDSDSADSTQAGYLMMNYRRNFYRGFADLFFQLDAGFSYNTGKGLFSDDNSESRTTINFWVVPIDFMLGTKIHLGRYVGLSLAGGPSVAAILQNRSDREEGADDKDLRQMGTGYAAQASLDISLSQIFSSYGNYLKNNSEVSDLSLSFIGRTMQLSNFKKEDLEISGTSIGVGFKFELL